MLWYTQDTGCVGRGESLSGGAWTSCIQTPPLMSDSHCWHQKATRHSLQMFIMWLFLLLMFFSLGDIGRLSISISSNYRRYFPGSDCWMPSKDHKLHLVIIKRLEWPACIVVLIVLITHIHLWKWESLPMQFSFLWGARAIQCLYNPLIPHNDSISITLNFLLAVPLDYTHVAKPVIQEWVSHRYTVNSVLHSLFSCLRCKIFEAGILFGIFYLLNNALHN